MPHAASPKQNASGIRFLIRAFEDVKLGGEGERYLHLIVLSQSLLQVWVCRVDNPLSCE